jgi:hypothetical protein
MRYVCVVGIGEDVLKLTSVQPFVQECIKARQFQEASKYIMKCEPATRPMLFVKIGAFREAAEQAFTNKDMATLKLVS